jgi:hypothetical protein
MTYNEFMKTSYEKSLLPPYRVSKALEVFNLEKKLEKEYRDQRQRR